MKSEPHHPQAHAKVMFTPLNPSVFEMHHDLGAIHRLPHHKRPVKSHTITSKELTGYFGDQDATIHETIYDDLSRDRIIKKTNVDKYTLQDGLKHVDHDGITRYFIDRY